MSDSEGNQGSEHCSKCELETLTGLYQLNIEAKRYAESAEGAYTAGFKSDARLYSLRKKALYGLKREILRELSQNGCVDTVHCHEINGRDYYCFYINEFSFHTPTSEWEKSPLDAPTGPTESLNSFDANPENRDDALSEEEALKCLTEKFETPNNYLQTPFVDRDYSSDFAGWSYLPGAIEEGDRVDRRFDQDITNLSNDFLFNVGDEFQTKKGKCKVLDRYQSWLSPWLDRSPVMPRTVYDVELDGELHETVRQRRIVDDWVILVDDLSDPVPNVTGKQAELAENSYEEIGFDIGDILELRPMRDDSDPCYCKIVEASLSYNLVMVEFEPVEPTEEAPLGLSVGEFVDDVVKVYNEPPKLN